MRILFLTALSLMLFASPAVADRTATGGEVIVISDEIWGKSVDVERPASADDTQRSGNDQNRSGLGDGTNPGQGSGRDNATNEGTDNPNNAPDSDSGSRGRGKAK